MAMLTEAQIRAVKSKEKSYKVFDTRGLYRSSLCAQAN